MGSRGVLGITAFLIALSGVDCRSDRIPGATMEEIRQAHGRMLTVDGLVVASRASAGLAKLMKKGRLDAVFLTAPIQESDITPGAGAPECRSAAESVRRIKRTAGGGSPPLSIAGKPEDTYRLEKAGQAAVYIGLELGDAKGDMPALVAACRDAGVHRLALVGPTDNRLGDSALDAAHPEDRGLSDLGKSVVAQCNRLGLLIDLANGSDQTILDVLSVSRAPVVVTRGAAKALCDRPGNLGDDVIRAIGNGGGVVLVSLDPRRLVAGTRTARATVADVADHIERVARLAGIDGVGIGSGFGEGGGTTDCRNEAQILNLTVELLRRGIGESGIERIWGGNIMRVLREAKDRQDRPQPSRDD